MLKNFHTVDHTVKEVSNTIWRTYARKLISAKDASLKFRACKKIVGVNVKLDEEDLVD